MRACSEDGAPPHRGTGACGQGPREDQDGSRGQRADGREGGRDAERASYTERENGIRQLRENGPVSGKLTYGAGSE